MAVDRSAPAWPTLSVVTPSLNHAAFIETTLRSVLEQGYPHLEYRVVDGGSQDGTVEILKRFHERYPNFEFTIGSDGGQSAAVNMGFAQTMGSIIGWIHSDDYYASGALLTVGRYFMEHPEVQWVYGRCPMVDRHGKPGYRPWATAYKNFLMRHYSYRWHLVENFICQPAVFFRRSLLERVGRLNPDCHSAMDYDLFLRMACLSKPGFIDQDLAYFRMRGERKTSQQYGLGLDEALQAARGVAQGKHPLMLTLHRLNQLKLLFIYRILQALGD